MSIYVWIYVHIRCTNILNDHVWEKEDKDLCTDLTTPCNVPPTVSDVGTETQPLERATGRIRTTNTVGRNV